MNDEKLLIALCPGCHARVHRLLQLRTWLPEVLVDCWRELHPSSSHQLQFPLEGMA